MTHSSKVLHFGFGFVEVIPGLPMKHFIMIKFVTKHVTMSFLLARTVASLYHLSWILDKNARPSFLNVWPQISA